MSITAEQLLSDVSEAEGKRYGRPLSASSIETFLTCNSKFDRQYLLGIPRDSDSDSLRFGTAIHTALEKLEKFVIKNSVKKFTEANKKFFIQDFRKICAEERLADFELMKEGEGIIKEYIDSYDFSDKVLALEYKFPEGFATKKGVRLAGAIDKLVEIDSDTLVVIDYKTSNYFKTQSELYNDIQLSIYDLAVHYLFPQYKNVILMLHYLKGKPVCSFRTDEDRERFEDFLFEIDRRIRSLEAGKGIEQKNKFCAWCSYRNICTAYNKTFYSLDKYPELYINDETDEEQAIKAKELISINSSILEERRRSYDFWIANHHEQNGRPVSNGSFKARIRQSGKINYDNNVVYNTVPVDEFLKMVSVKKKNMDDFLKANPKYREKIEKSSSFSYNNFYVDIEKNA